jgi:glutathione S-transferase
VSLRALGFAYEHDTRSVFGDFDGMRQVNPLCRIPSFILDDGEILIDSAAILDWLDQAVRPERALIPAVGPERRRVLRRIALAIDKTGAATYERLIRPSTCRWPEWTERYPRIARRSSNLKRQYSVEYVVSRCRTQATGAIGALAAESWPTPDRLDQAPITTACMIRNVRMADPDLVPPGRYPALDSKTHEPNSLSRATADT